ncbi:hypothetical protein N7478_010586 [Penicillium angulare]|uniref:uncharacterized protein n=1 Tax=Penicillium angulare TaxID=116970 RepID=UPI0025421E4B|nr:uncharacterized protein N7478_010586 [Penicillium angulare]KAJ5267778.1 hypothetical protein N7478_010586 [Penicillium angulare]
MTLYDLPPELLIAIGEEIHQSHNAVALASTNRFLNTLFQPLAYKTIVQHESSYALTRAGSHNSPHVVRQILSYPGVNVNTHDGRRRTPVFHAIRTKNLEILQILHSTSKIDYNWKDDNGQAPLIYALSRNRISIGLCLLKWHCSDLAIHDHIGRSALWYAVYFGNETVVTELLRRGGDMKRSDCKGISPLILAIYKNHLPIVNVMLRIAGSARGLYLVDDSALSKPLSLALHLGRLDIAQCLLSYGADPNGSDVYGETALQIAIRKDDKKAVALLLQ